MKKRFIAGAVCPSCSKEDTLRWWQESNIEYVECVDCGHTDRRTPKSLEKPNMRKMMLLVFLSLNSIMLPY